MTKTILNPPDLPPPRGFSHGVLAQGAILALAGQTAHDAAGQLVGVGDVVTQYHQALHNCQGVVTAAGGTMGDIVQMMIFVQDRDDYRAHLTELGEVHRAFFGAYYPALALFEVSRFFEDGILVEINGMAVIGSAGQEVPDARGQQIAGSEQEAPG